MGDFLDEKRQVKETEQQSIVTVGKLPLFMEKLFEKVKVYVKAYNDRYYYHKGYINKMENTIENHINKVESEVRENLHDKSFYVTPKYEYDTSVGDYRLVDTELNLNEDSSKLEDPPDYRNVVYIPPCDEDSDGNAIHYTMNMRAKLVNRSVFGDGVRTIIDCGDPNDDIELEHPAFSLENNSTVANFTLSKGNGGFAHFALYGSNVTVKDISTIDEANIGIEVRGNVENAIVDNVHGKLVKLTTDGAINVKNLVIRNSTINSLMDINVSGDEISSIRFENCVIAKSTEDGSIEGNNLEVSMVNCKIDGMMRFRGIRSISIVDSYLEDDCDIDINGCKNIEIVNNGANPNAKSSAITIENLSSCEKFNITDTDKVNIDDVYNQNGNYNKLWSKKSMGISMMPINAFSVKGNNVPISTVDMLEPGEAVLYNDKSGGTSPLSALAITYRQGNDIKTVHPFTILETQNLTGNFMTNWEVSSMVNEVCKRGANGMEPGRPDPNKL